MKTALFLLTLATLLISCSETHQNIYNYEKVYHTESVDSFKMGHFKDKVSGNIVYLNDDSRFNRTDLEELCDRNRVKCFIQDFNVNSTDVKSQLEATMNGMKSFKDEPVLLVSSNRDSAALFVSTYAYRMKNASEKLLTQIATDLGASSTKISKIVEVAKSTP